MPGVTRPGRDIDTATVQAPGCLPAVTPTSLPAMLAIASPNHALHAPQHEFFRGERVRCFETPSRAEYVLAELAARGHEVRAPHVDSADVLPRVHSPAYLHFLQTAWQQWLAIDPANASVQPFPSVWPVRTLRHDVEPDNFIARLGLYSMDNGTPLAAGSWQAAKAGADAAVSAAALLSQGERAVFCATRPPGHHAGADFMGGYCLLNNAAIAAEALLARGCQRVAVLDVDYHHGNGTQSIFYARSDVLFVSIHGDPRTEYPFYLGHADETGSGEGAGFNLNLPLPAGTPADRWFAALEVACHRVTAHGADALVVSLGLDTYAGDPISKFALQSPDFVRLGQRLHALGLPTALILEGGYAAQELGVNAANVLSGFA
jgi:acetoin utilization deacetylase AcuC-like enzyme